MSFTSKVLEVFGLGRAIANTAGTGTTEGGIEMTNDCASYIIGNTKWVDLDEEMIFENMYGHDPEVGSGLDKMGTMVADAFKGFFAMPSEDYEPMEIEVPRNMFTDEVSETAIPPSKGVSDDKIKLMVKAANKLFKDLGVKDVIEAFSDIMAMHGNLIVYEDPKTFSLRILPNARTTLLDNKSRITNPSMKPKVMRDVNVVIVDEGDPQEQEEFAIDNVYIVKYRGTPVHFKDSKGRDTFGVYGVSPLQRAIIPIWHKRQVQAIDILVRWKLIPKENHKLRPEMYTLDRYPGDKLTKLEMARNQMKADMAAHRSNLDNQAPDQGYITTGIDIESVDHSSASYMQANDLISQLQGQVLNSINVPMSVATGESNSSYASELIVSNYTSVKVVRIAEKILPIVMNNIKKRLLVQDSSFPVDLLDMKLEFVLANTELERIKQAVALNSMPTNVTRTEVRERAMLAPLSTDQEEDLVSNYTTAIQKDIAQNSIEAKASIYPDTSTSSGQRPTSPGMSKAEKSTTT